jgi:hypothetical protein
MKPRRLILEATIDEAVIHGTLTGLSGQPRRFYGWLEFNTAVETALSEAPGAEGSRPTADQLKRQ